MGDDDIQAYQPGRTGDSLGRPISPHNNKTNPSFGLQVTCLEVASLHLIA
jgi:hypothetical protein